MTARPLFALTFLSLASGCGGGADPAVEIHSLGAIDAFGRVGETSLLARYSPKLDGDSCVILDGSAECVLVQCKADQASDLEDAGEVTVAGDALDIAEDNSYSLVLPEELVVGDELEMGASGSSAVPKHSGAVTVPERALVTSSLADPLVLDPSIDFVLDWTPLESDRVVLTLTFEELELSCVASASVGQIRVASRLVSALPDDASGSFRILNENLVTSSVSAWQVVFGAHQVIVEGAAELAATP